MAPSFQYIYAHQDTTSAGDGYPLFTCWVAAISGGFSTAKDFNAEYPSILISHIYPSILSTTAWNDWYPTFAGCCLLYLYIYIKLLLLTWFIFKLLYYTILQPDSIQVIHILISFNIYAPAPVACQSPVAISPSDSVKKQGQAVTKDPPGVEVERPELGPLPDHLGPPKGPWRPWTPWIWRSVFSGRKWRQDWPWMFQKYGVHDHFRYMSCHYNIL